MFDLEITLYEYLKQSFLSMEVTTMSATIKLVISFMLGAVIGVERQTRRRSAGIRTFSLICMGSTAAMLLSIWIPQSYPHFLNGDPGRIAAQILTGIGFLGAGAIIQSKGNVHGLTTAAAIWVVAIIGMCVGSGMYIPSFVLTFISLFILVTIDQIEKKKILTGDVKYLIIRFNTDCPNFNEVLRVLKERNVFIYNVSLEKDYSLHTSQIAYKIQVDPSYSLDPIFDDLRKIDNVVKINLEMV